MFIDIWESVLCSFQPEQVVIIWTHKANELTNSLLLFSCNVYIWWIIETGIEVIMYSTNVNKLYNVDIVDYQRKVEMDDLQKFVLRLLQIKWFIATATNLQNLWLQL